MFNFQRQTIESFVAQLQAAYQRTYGDIEPQFANIIAWSGRLALENIANTDALYHNVEHTVMVTLAGQSILEGKHIIEGGVTPRDWLHYTVALLCHDIGYVRGVCRGDSDDTLVTGVGDQFVEVSPGGTDVALTDYHVDRSMRFVRERFGGGLLLDMGRLIDAETIAGYIEMTRFPVPDEKRYRETASFAGLARAADWIGQLGDPDYLRKTPALFYEFEETGSNRKFGYERPGDLRRAYARFYWNVVSQYIGKALEYLRVTQEGKQWIANLHANVFAAEHSGS